MIFCWIDEFVHLKDGEPITVDSNNLGNEILLKHTILLSIVINFFKNELT